MRIIIIMASSLFIFSPLARAADIPELSLGQDGKAEVRSIPYSKYFQKIQGAVSSVHESILPELKSAADRGLWKLHTIAVGIGIGVQVGLGPIISVEAKPRIRLIYTRGKEPYFPIH